MMGLHATLRRSGGLDALSRRLAIPPADVASAAARLLPPLLSRYHRLYRRSGAGLAGVAAVTALAGRYGGGDLAIAILASGPITAEACAGLLAGLLDPGESADTLVAEAASIQAPASPAAVDPAGTVPGNDIPGDNGDPAPGQMAQVLPLLNLLVAGYLTARADAARHGDDDIAAEFERLFGASETRS
jgi:hypothetical protein